jgi:hypothetical protein
MSCPGCSSNLFGASSQYIKTNAGDIIATDGANIREKLILSDMRIPYKQILKSRVIMKPGQIDYLLNHLGLGDNATFLTLRASYDPKSKMEEDNYVQYSFYDDLNKVYAFSQVMTLTGNSTNRIKQMYLTNPNATYPVFIDVMVAVIDDTYQFFNDFVNQTATTFTGLSHTDIQSFVVCQSIVIYDKSTPPQPLTYFTISEIASVQINGLVITIEDSIKDVVLKFIDENEAILAINLLNYIMEHPCVEISPANPEPPTPNVDSVIMYQFAHGYMNPADSNNYYIGNNPSQPAQNNSTPSYRIKSVVTGMAKEVTLSTHINGTLGSSQSQTFLLHNVTAGLSSSITSTYKHETNSQNDNFTLSVLLPVNKNDELEIIWQTPTFDIEPTMVSHNFIVYIEY